MVCHDSFEKDCKGKTLRGFAKRRSSQNPQKAPESMRLGLFPHFALKKQDCAGIESNFDWFLARLHGQAGSLARRQRDSHNLLPAIAEFETHFGARARGRVKSRENQLGGDLFRLLVIPPCSTQVRVTWLVERTLKEFIQFKAGSCLHVAQKVFGARVAISILCIIAAYSFLKLRCAKLFTQHV